MEAIIEAKGPDSIRVTWVKGHADESHFSSGKSSPLLKLGNDQADAMADKGVDEHLDGLMQLTHFYIAKQKVASELLVRMYRMFIRVMKRDKELREKKAETHQYTVEGSNAGTCSSGVLSSSVNDASG